MEQLLCLRDLSRLYRVSRATLYRMLARGELPQPITVSLRAKRWKASEIEKILAEINSHERQLY